MAQGNKCIPCCPDDRGPVIADNADAAPWSHSCLDELPENIGRRDGRFPASLSRGCLVQIHNWLPPRLDVLLDAPTLQVGLGETAGYLWIQTLPAKLPLKYSSSPAGLSFEAKKRAGETDEEPRERRQRYPHHPDDLSVATGHGYSSALERKPFIMLPTFSVDMYCRVSSKACSSLIPDSLSRL